MTSLVGGIKGERNIRVCECDHIQPRVDNVMARWPQNSLNFSVRIRRLGASPLPENSALTWERVRQSGRQGEEAADITCRPPTFKNNSLISLFYQFLLTFSCPLRHAAGEHNF